jgi:hypothetical protein
VLHTCPYLLIVDTAILAGPIYLLQFVLPRTITENTLRRGFAPPSGEHE